MNYFNWNRISPMIWVVAALQMSLGQVQINDQSQSEQALLRLRAIQAKIVAQNGEPVIDRPAAWFDAARKIDPDSEDGVYLEIFPRNIVLTSELAGQLIQMADIVFEIKKATAEPAFVELRSATGDILADMGLVALPFVQKALNSDGLSPMHRKILVHVQKRILAIQAQTDTAERRRVTRMEHGKQTIDQTKAVNPAKQRRPEATPSMETGLSLVFSKDTLVWLITGIFLLLVVIVIALQVRGKQ